MEYEQRGGGFRIRGRARVLRGRREHTLPAPLEELPLLVRAGALVAMLPADVDTLSDYGRGSGAVRLADRRDRMTLLAFPRGLSKAEFNEGEWLASREHRDGWALRVRGARRRTYALQASLLTLRKRLRPCRLTFNGRRLRRRAWRYGRRTGILRVRFRARRGRLVAHRCRRRSARRRQ